MATGLAGCTGSQDGGSGGDGGGGGSEPTPTGTPEPTPTDTATATATPEPTASADETVVVGPDGALVFDPDELRVDEGATVLWRWDSGGHTVTVERQPDGADWRATGQETHGSGFTHTHTFEVAGTYEYVCLPHESAGMVGSVTVGDAGTPGPSTTVGVRSHPDLGEILVGPDGRTLYMFDRDTRGAGASTCHEDCAGAWPPLTVDEDPTAGDGVTAELSTFEREDGSTQVAANGWPLYYFADDGAPDDANGQGAGDVWWVLGPDGMPKRPEPTPTPEPSATVRVQSHPDLGELLVGPDDHTLYMFDRDTRGAGSSTCSGDCAGAWPPLTVDGEPTAGDGVTAELTTFEREGGGTQVAANGWPLYYFADDEEPGDANGQGVGDVWWVLGPGGTPKRPPATPTRTPTAEGGEGGGGGYY